MKALMNFCFKSSEEDCINVQNELASNGRFDVLQIIEAEQNKRDIENQKVVDATLAQIHTCNMNVADLNQSKAACLKQIEKNDEDFNQKTKELIFSSTTSSKGQAANQRIDHAPRKCTIM